MKKENGITLISLVITIILILILASVSIYTGVDIYEQMRVKNFVAKMKAVQVAVDKVCDKYTVQEINSKIGIIANSTDVPTEDINVLSQVISEGNADKLKSWYSDAGDGVNSNYRYLTKERINSDLGLKDFDTSIFFNPRTRNIIAVKGVKHENKIYYRQYDLPEGQELKEPNTDTDFNLNVSVKTFDNKAVIYVSHEKDGNNINITELKYFKQKEDGTFGDGIISRNLNEITITESGTYKVEAKVNGSSTETITEETRNVKDGVITKTADNIKVAIVNKPMLVDGMVPVKYDASGNQIQTTANDKDWYNYGNKEWANVILKDGSVYVWIPRYAYSITYTNPSEISEGGTIDVEFMKETSSSITTSGDTLKDSYKVMPAFQDGTRNGFANGEWDSELTGIWVAKYETTEKEGKPKNFLTSEKQVWRDNRPAIDFNLCRKMEGEFKDTYFENNVEAASGRLLYGQYGKDNNNIDTHLMKNSEWGAIAYLSDSDFGAGAINISRATSYYIKDGSGDGNSAPEFSSTNNYTGIYGLNGGAFDLVASGVNFAGQYNFENKSTKYATIYNSEITSNTNTIYGDAMQETFKWNKNIVENPLQLIIRGGYMSTGLRSGIFSYQNKHYYSRWN